MRQLFFIIASCFLLSCSDKNEPRDTRLDENTISKVFENFPDSLLEDKKANSNEFIIKRKADTLDLNLMAVLNGTWRVTNKEELSFLQTQLHYSDTIVFNDSTTTTMTGWGKIKYNSPANFYTAKDISYQYDFYVSKDKKLVLTWIEYRNNDLSFKEKPETKCFSFNIHLLKPDQIEIRWDTFKFVLSKIADYR